MFVAKGIEMVKDHTDIHQQHYIGTNDNPGNHSSEVLMWQMTKLFKNGFEDHLFSGNQQQSGPFKITKERFYRLIQK